MSQLRGEEELFQEINSLLETILVSLATQRNAEELHQFGAQANALGNAVFTTNIRTLHKEIRAGLCAIADTLATNGPSQEVLAHLDCLHRSGV